MVEDGVRAYVAVYNYNDDHHRSVDDKVVVVVVVVVETHTGHPPIGCGAIIALVIMQIALNSVTFRCCRTRARKIASSRAPR